MNAGMQCEIAERHHETSKRADPGLYFSGTLSTLKSENRTAFRRDEE